MLYKAITLPKPLAPKSWPQMQSTVYMSTISGLIYESLVPQPAVSHWISVLWSVVRWLLCGVDVASGALWFIGNYLLVIVEAKLWRYFVKYWPRLNQIPPPFDPLCIRFWSCDRKYASANAVKIFMSTYEVDYRARGNKRFGALFCFFGGVANLGHLSLKRKGDRFALIFLKKC